MIYWVNLHQDTKDDDDNAQCAPQCVTNVGRKSSMMCEGRQPIQLKTGSFSSKYKSWLYFSPASVKLNGHHKVLVLIATDY